MSSSITWFNHKCAEMREWKRASFGFEQIILSLKAFRQMSDSWYTPASPMSRKAHTKKRKIKNNIFVFMYSFEEISSLYILSQFFLRLFLLLLSSRCSLSRNSFDMRIKKKISLSCHHHQEMRNEWSEVLYWGDEKNLDEIFLWRILYNSVE